MNDVEGSDEVVQSLIDVIGFAPDINLIRGSERHMNKEDAPESIREPIPREEKKQNMNILWQRQDREHSTCPAEPNRRQSRDRICNLSTHR